MSSSEDEVLLQQLSPEELKQLGEYIDPEVETYTSYFSRICGTVKIV